MARRQGALGNDEGGTIARSPNMSEEDEGEFDYYIIHDSVGVSHVLKKRKGEPPMFRDCNCDDLTPRVLAVSLPQFWSHYTPGTAILSTQQIFSASFHQLYR